MTGAADPGARAVILDRDGVINDNRRQVYVNSVADFELFPDAAAAIRLLNEAGFQVYVATNQGGVGLGYLTEQTLDEIHRHMLDLLSRQGARIADIAVCTHAPRAGCECRKPKPGMLFQLQRRHGFDLTRSYMVGDRDTDIAAGRAAGTRTVWIDHGETGAASSGKGYRPVSGEAGPLADADFRAADLLTAARWIVRDAGL